MGDSVPHRQPHPLRRRHVLRHLRIRWEAAVGRSTRGRRCWYTSTSQEPTTTAATTTVTTSGGGCSDCAPSRDVIVRRDHGTRWTLPDQDGDGADTDCATWWHLSERLCQRTQPVARWSRVDDIQSVDWWLLQRVISYSTLSLCVRRVDRRSDLTYSLSHATLRPASLHRHSTALVSRFTWD